MSQTNIQVLIDNGPIQPTLDQYPTTNKRRFNPIYFEKYPFLEYSKNKDSVYCFPCRLFSNDATSRALIKDGVNTWTNLTKKLDRHAFKSTHINANETYITRKHETIPTIANAFGISNSIVEAERANNRLYLSKVFSIIITIMKQGIAFRGHREHMEEQYNNGNFLAILRLIAKYDSQVSNWLISGPGNGLYTSGMIQNDMIGIVGTAIDEKITSHVKMSKYTSIMMDETTDRSKKEQTSLCLRYVFEGTIYERLVKMKSVANADAATIFNFMKDYFLTHCLDMQWIVGQSYDGASVMKGCQTGVATRVLDIVPHASFTWCTAHRLALVVEDSCKSNTHVMDGFSLLGMVHNFFSASTVKTGIWNSVRDNFNWQHISDIVEQPSSNIKSWQSLSQTRWWAREYNCEAMVNNFPVLMETLDQCDESGPVIAFIEKFKPIATVFCIYPVLEVLQQASLAFQKIDYDIGRMCSKIGELKSCIHRMRNDHTFDTQFEKARNICEYYNIETQPKSRIRRRPTTLEGADSYAGMQLPANRHGHIDDSMSWNNIFKRDMWYSFMDLIIQTLDNRFNNDTMTLGTSIHAFSNFNDTTRDEILNKFLDKYPTLKSMKRTIIAERLLWVEHMRIMENRTIDDKSKSISSKLAKIIKYMHTNNLHEEMPSMYEALVVAGTIPFSSASCERSFSTLDLIKNAMRSTMGEERLDSLMKAYTNNDILSTLEEDKLVDMFKLKPRRIAL